MSQAKPYHHGDLRTALFAVAHAQLERGGHESLSLRALAAEIGAASSAPYRHFATREALLAALAADGAADLARRYTKPAPGLDAPIDRLEQACLQYLAFADERPALFRLMFVADIRWERRPEGAEVRQITAYPIFERLTEATMAGAGAAAVGAKALAIWAMIHGMAMLKLNARLSRDYIGGQADIAAIRAILRPPP